MVKLKTESLRTKADKLKRDKKKLEYSIGQTISNEEVYLHRHAFLHGKLYVALPRGTTMLTKKVQVMIEQPD